MKEKRNVHLKVQELCDCYATNDPLKEMSSVKNEGDKDEAALKWLALTALHGVNGNAEKITITHSKDGEISVTAKYRESELPAPGSKVGAKNIGGCAGNYPHRRRHRQDTSGAGYPQ